jgi:acyl-CoA synthetase (AMP-forming)/AMP-acid ligase II
VDLDAEQPGMLRFSQLMAQGTSADERIDAIAATLSNHDPINIQFTSGTTGFPKGATLTHRNILNNGFFIGECMRLTPEDRLCIPVPLYHCFGMVLGNLACFTHGATIVYPNDGFDSRCWKRCRPRNARACTACPPCSSPSSTIRALPSSICPRCAPASWPARPVPSR